MADQAYLDPDFDPASVTIPRLRSILVENSIDYPSSAKKAQLVDLFNEHVRPRAAKMRSANARVRRTSRGIVDVPSSQASMNDEEDDDLLQAPPAAATRSARKSTRARTEEVEDVEPTPRRVRHSTAPPEGTTPRRASSKHARTAEAQYSEPERKRPTSRKSRPAATPVVKSEERDGESPFSSENVFQSGSSPISAPSRSRDAERRRTTASASRSLERRSKEARRRTEEVKPVRQQMDGAVVPTRKTFEMPIASLGQDVVEPTEEFTPEESQELIRLEQSGEVAPRRRKTPRTASHAARVGPAAVFSAALLGLATLWRQEKVNVGYCGVGHPTTELYGTEIPDWVEPIRPQCEPCPPHAYCGENLETVCDQDFVLTQHPLSLGGLLPIPPTCEPDGAKAIKVASVKERAIAELREQNAKYECGEASKPVVKETALKQAMSSKRRKGMSNDEFEDLWASAIGEIHSADEIVVGADGSGDFTLRSNSLARVPITCAIRRSIRQTLRQYLWQLVMLGLIVGSGAYGRHTITSGRETESRAKELARQALQMLSQQAALHAYNPDVYRENYISMAQLRDDVLRDEFSASRRTKLWQKVQSKVEGNSNVRPMVRENRSGDVGRVWEWTGAVGMIDSPQAAAANGDASAKRKNNRVSFGGTDERLIESRDQSVSEITKWQEGGKTYY